VRNGSPQLVNSESAARINPEHLDKLACPECRGNISLALNCTSCGRPVEAAGRVLRMLPDAPNAGGHWGTDLLSIFKSGQTEMPRYHHDRFTTTSGQCKNLRERAVVDTFLRRLPKGSWVVDIPCGMGRFSDLAQKRGLRYCGIDLNLDHVTFASEQTRDDRTLWIQGDLSAPPLRSSSMAAALCIRVSYYFDDDTLARILSGLGRVSNEILLSYRDAGSLVGRWQSMRGLSSRKASKNRTFPQIRDIAMQAGLRVMGGPFRRIALCNMQFVHLHAHAHSRL
jgi:hypothetical protein